MESGDRSATSEATCCALFIISTGWPFPDVAAKIGPSVI